MIGVTQQKNYLKFIGISMHVNTYDSNNLVMFSGFDIQIGAIIGRFLFN